MTEADLKQKIKVREDNERLGILKELDNKILNLIPADNYIEHSNMKLTVL